MVWLNNYNWNLDETIGKVLYDNRKMSSGRLKRAVEQSLISQGRLEAGKSISKATFSSHLALMLECNPTELRHQVHPVLEKKDAGRGKAVFYSLTEEARKRIALGLLLGKIDHWREREKAYQLLFYYSHGRFDLSLLSQDRVNKYTFRSKKDLVSFLSLIRLREQDFNIIDRREDTKRDIRTLTMVEPMENVKIMKKDHVGDVIYRYAIPGITAKDIIEGRKTKVVHERSGYVFEHIFDFLSLSDVEQMFKLLLKEGLMRRIESRTLTYLEEERFEVEEELSKFIDDCWLKLFNQTHFRMMYYWKTIRRPTQAEKEWYYTIWGKHRANIFFIGYQKRLQENKKDKLAYMKGKSGVEPYIEKTDKSLPAEYERIRNVYENIIRNYQYPSNRLLELVYPPFLRALHKYV